MMKTDMKSAGRLKGLQNKERKVNTMNINKMIKEYKTITDNMSAEKKTADMLKKQIMEYAKNNDCFMTDEYTVIIKTTESTRLDTTALYKDFPDIKETYGKTTVSKSLSIAENATVKTA